METCRFGVPTELAALQAAIDGYLARVGRESLILVAPAAQALDALRAALHHADGVIAEQQTRIGKLYELFIGWEDRT